MKETKKYILVVDDDLDILVFCEKILSNIGVVVLKATNTEDALKKILEYAPHMVLLDINLENEAGFKLLDSLKEREILQYLKIYMISSEKSKESILLSKKYGVQGYLIKPLSNNTLVNTVKRFSKESALPTYTPVDESKLAKVYVPAEIIKFNEISFVLRSRVKFMTKENIEIESQFFRDMNIKKGHMKIYQKSRDINPGIYDTVMQMIGLPEKILQSIRKRQKRRI
ncbi:putative response regulator [Halobacteriovorax marinus SJ]|uniref:Response regulator n=1 Tax=Halobacteriovorax marinus (strain ATCC BAA-682 / DSM 15412 / SJ) TaxID=862908 RepID=E1WZJ3_HALMS|nr:response regulator [Halobacteriovorax marinus]CBW26179.1 putative response regulator [Halobacteriovorax marinus SJ]